MNLNRFFITFCGAGLAPKAPGTVGSFFALIVGLIILKFIPMSSFFLLTIAVSIIGIFEIDKYERLTSIHDDKSVVIDEVAGMWISMIFAISVVSNISLEYAYEIGVALSFITFRLFDIWKPSTIGYIDREVGGGLGVMGDDILAGFASGLLSSLILVLLNRVL